jgi:hypothetical protein
MDINMGSAYICATLRKGTPCLIGRNGTIETQVLSYGAGVEGMRKKLEMNAGVFPSTQESVEAWIRAYKTALNCIEDEPIVAGWYEPMKVAEERILKQYCLSDTYIPLRSLEPYYIPKMMSSLRWTSLLDGKRVAVVTSFAKSVASQVLKGPEIWGSEADTLLPRGTTWIPIQTGYSPELAQGRATWPPEVTNWQEAVAYLKKKVIEAGAEICIIGCGGLGMILGAELKKEGLQCIVMGGATQVLFGIKGKRWASHDVISKMWTDGWVWPSLEETPGGASAVEGSCYWS